MLHHHCATIMHGPITRLLKKLNTEFEANLLAKRWYCKDDVYQVFPLGPKILFSIG